MGKKHTSSKINPDQKGRNDKPGSLRYVWKRIRKNPGALWGLIFVIVLFILSFLSPYICKYDYQEIIMKSRFAFPSAEHLLGCDEVGRDILSRILYGAKYTLSIGILSTAFSGIAGVLLGAVAGYFGGSTDTLIMRCLDVFQAFPNILLAIAISAVLGSGFDKVIYAIGISGIPNFARMMRANILTVRNQEFIEAATSINCSTFRIIAHHVVPNAISPLIVQVAMGIASSALAASGLSFLGFGVQAPTPEWGAMLASARGYMRDYPHLVIIPGLFIMLTVLSFNLVDDAIRDALDPKLRD